MNLRKNIYFNGLAKDIVLVVSRTDKLKMSKIISKLLINASKSGEIINIAAEYLNKNELDNFHKELSKYTESLSLVKEIHRREDFKYIPKEIEKKEIVKGQGEIIEDRDKKTSVELDPAFN